MMARGKIIVVLIGTYALCVALACGLWQHPALLTGCYIIISIMFFWRWHAPSDVICYVVAFILGPVGEIFAVSYGAWSYTKPLYFIPTWLPFLWGLAILVVKNLSETLLTRRDFPRNK
jgi:uncharacterized membrane protein YoaT (DUF817 family)